MSGARAVLDAPGAPRAVGPYSPAIVVDAAGLVFCAGQIPLDPVTGEMIDGDLAAQTRRVLDNLAAVLRAAGSGPERIVRATIYLTDLGQFARVNEIWAGYFAAPFPARATVEVTALPKGALIEVDAIATLPAPARPG